ncbi:MAG: ABC transporter ATP-binding protein [Victivallales bacterium]
MSAINITKLTKTFFTDIIANNDINLNIKRGEFFCLLGPNGAGKSTLVRQITTELIPTSGCICVFDVDVTIKPAKAKKLMGIMPQECGMYEHLTAKQHIQIFSRLKNIGVNYGVPDVISDLKLEKHQEKKVGELSFGLKKQVLLAIALLGDPPILILDEPSAGLDPEARRNVWDLLRRKKKEGTTILLTTHQLEEAEYLSDRFGIISEGRLIHVGTIESLRSSLNNRFELKMKRNDNADSHLVRYFDDIQTAVDFIQKKRIEGFSLATISLENVYFELIGAGKC